jgi:hypothetical protein
VLEGHWEFLPGLQGTSGESQPSHQKPNDSKNGGYFVGIGVGAVGYECWYRSQSLAAPRISQGVRAEYPVLFLKHLEHYQQ